jgi:7-cyano-7-deazaguanine synthase
MSSFFLNHSTGAVVLLSGGLDSTVALASTLVNDPKGVVQVLLMDYGQRSFPKELEASRQIAEHYGLPHQVIRLDWLRSTLPEGMQPEGASHHQGNLGLKSVWVPNRNGTILNIAAGVAESLGVNRVVFGANREEAEAGFPDNTTEYWQRLNAALALSTLNQVQVIAPVSDLYKAEIVKRGLELKAPLEKIWSCYEAGEKHCGHCASCQLLKQASQKVAPELWEKLQRA